MLPPLSEEPRLDLAIEHFNRREFELAADLMEELFFEASGAERPLARVLLQLFVGMVHVEQAQPAPAQERLIVGVDEASNVRDWMGIDGASLVEAMEQIVRQLREGRAPGEIHVVRARR